MSETHKDTHHRQTTPPDDDRLAAGSVVRCRRCGYDGEPVAPGRCGNPGCRSFVTGTQAARTHGARSTTVIADLHQQASTQLAARREALEADLGGNLGVVKRDLVTRYLETSLLADHLGSHLVAEGTLTAKGRARAALGAYLQVVDRQHRLALALGLERRPRPVRSLDDVLAGDDDG